MDNEKALEPMLNGDFNAWMFEQVKHDPVIASAVSRGGINLGTSGKWLRGLVVYLSAQNQQLWKQLAEERRVDAFTRDVE